MDIMEFINVFFNMNSMESNPLANLLMVIAGSAALGLFLVGMARAFTHIPPEHTAPEERIAHEDLQKAA